MRRWIWLPVGLVAVVALLIAATWAMGTGDGGGSEVEEGLPPAEAEEVPAEPPPPEIPVSNRLEDRFSPIVLSYRGRNNLNPGETIESEGFEFVLAAELQYLEQVVGVIVRFPDGETTRELDPSTVHGVPLAFFGYYGSSDGLPPAGDYVFEIAMKDGTQLEAVNQFDGRVLELPENVAADIDRDAGTIRVTWDPVEGVRNYTVDLQEVLPGGVYNFVERAGCPDPDLEDPNAPWTETSCTLTDLNSYLEEGKEYGIQIAVWSDFSYGGIDGAAVFTW